MRSIGGTTLLGFALDTELYLLKDITDSSGHFGDRYEFLTEFGVTVDAITNPNSRFRLLYPRIGSEEELSGNTIRQTVLDTEKTQYESLDRKIGYEMMAVINRGEFRRIVKCFMPVWNIENPVVNKVETELYGRPDNFEKMMLKLAGLNLP